MTENSVLRESLWVEGGAQKGASSLSTNSLEKGSLKMNELIISMRRMEKQKSRKAKEHVNNKDWTEFNETGKMEKMNKIRF